MTFLTARAAVSAFNANPDIGPVLIADCAANLIPCLAGLSAMETAGAVTSVTLTGLNRVTASQATELAQLPGVSLGDGATLVVSDTGANLASTLFLTGINLATSLVLTGDSVVNVAALYTLSQLPNLTESRRAVLHVIDSAASLLTLSAANGLSLATYVLLAGANTVSAAQATTLAGLHRFGSVPGSTLTVSDTAANVLANLAAVGRYASNTVLTGPNTIAAADLVALTGVYHISLGAGATLVVNDTLAAYTAALAAISGLPPRAGWGAPAGVQLILSETPVSSAAALQADPATISFSVADTAADLTGSALVALEVDSKLSGITVTDSGVLSLSFSQYVGLGHVINLITGGFSLNVTDAPVWATSGLQSSALVSSFSVTDSFRNVFADTAALLGDTKLNSINGIGPTNTIAYSGPQASFYGQFFPHSLAVTDVPVAAIGVIAKLNSVAEFSITDTAAGFAGQTGSFAYLSQVSGINVSGTSGGDTIDLTGVVFPAAIDLGADPAAVSAGLSSPALSFIGSPDAVVLGSGPSTLLYSLESGSGIETIANFTYGVDTLKLDLKGAGAGVLQAFDTTVNGVNAIAVTSSADPTHGVVLLGLPASQTASDLLGNHTSFANGRVTIA